MPWWKTQLLEEGLAWEFTEREKSSSAGEGGGEVTLEELGVQWA